jgi:tRNA(Ile)-lysidine synthase
MTVVEKLRAANRKYALFASGDALLVAVSGGPDSVALLRALYDIRGELDLRLEVAHVQHGIRGEEAVEDARFVGRLAAELRLPFHLQEVDLPQIKSTAGRGNLEALGREARYDFFFAVARNRSIRKIATAHTRDDQAETLVMRLLRGSGRTGLAGIPPISSFRSAADAAPFTVVRPLIECSKAELMEFLTASGSAYRWDRTNDDPDFLRNWIRLRLLPELRRKTDEQLSARLARQAEILRDEDDLLDSMAEEALQNCRTDEVLRRQLLRSQRKPIRRRVLRLWLKEQRGHLRGVDLEHIEEFLRLIEHGPAHARLSVPGGWELINEYDTVSLKRRAAESKQLAYCYSLEVGRKLIVREAGVSIESEQLDYPLATRPASLWQAVFDSGELGGALTVRNFRRGDRFRPLGMAGHKKLKDLFIEKKVPLSLRGSLPVVCGCGQVLWIPGYGRSDLAKVGPRTRTILRLNALEDGKLSSNFSD